MLPTRPKRGLKKIDLGVVRILQSLGGEGGKGASSCSGVMVSAMDSGTRRSGFET